MELNDPKMQPESIAPEQSAASEETTQATEPQQEVTADEILTENTDMMVEAIAEVEHEADQEDNKAPAFETLDSLLEATRQLAERPAAEIERMEVSRLRQQFLKFEADEHKAALEQFVADGGKPEDFTPADSQPVAQMKELLNSIREKKAAYIAEQNEIKANNLKQKQEIINEINRLAEDTDNVYKTFDTYRELRDKYKAIGPVPATDDTAIAKEYSKALEHYSDNLKINKELRDYDFKKNLEQKEDLIRQATELAADNNDIVPSFNRLQELHEAWRLIGPVAKDMREDVWNRFKEASSTIRKRYQDFFEERKAREVENEKAKTEICERVEALDFEALKTYADWDEMTKQILQAQEDWRKIGFASRKMNNLLFNRFRETCDRFFEMKGNFYKGVKERMNDNMARKTALVEQAEALMNSTDWKATTDTLIALQKEWKTIGAVPKKHSDTLWQRFRAACDAFFDNKKKETSGTRLTEHANLQAKRDLIKELDNITDETPKHEARALINDLRERWKSIGHVPFKEKDKVYDAFRTRIDEVRKKFDLAEVRQRAARFEENLAAMAGDQSKISRERERLLRILEIRRQELRTYENNLGFLTTKSKSGNSLVKDLERRIEKLKEDIVTLEGQVNQLS